MFTDVVWYSVEFATYLCIIAYTLYTFGILKPLKVGKNEAPATFNETWKNANSFLGRASELANNFQKALEKKDEEEPKTK